MYDTVKWNIVGKDNFGYYETVCMQLILGQNMEINNVEY
jgi:hypothetical protein